MINVISRRFPLTKILLYPALVQGDNAYKTLIEGLEFFNREKNADVIIIGRGGGSMEDLWAFNSVDLAYAVARSEIPVISAVGHESDFTICDFVADLRAPTPSAAAELAVPDSFTVKHFISDSARAMEKQLTNQIQQYRKNILALSSSRVLTSKEALLDEYKMKLGIISDKLDSGIDAIINNKITRYQILTAKLGAISPLNTLSRGYAIVQNENGKTISRIGDVNENDIINISLADGAARASVIEIKQNSEVNND